MDAVSADNQVFAVPAFSGMEPQSSGGCVSRSCLRRKGRASELEGILLQVLAHPAGQGQPLHVGRAFVDAQPAQVLQAGHAVLAAQRPQQLQVYGGCCQLFLQGR